MHFGGQSEEHRYFGEVTRPSAKVDRRDSTVLLGRSTPQFVRTSCPTKALWSFKLTLNVVQTNALSFLAASLLADPRAT